MRKFFRIKITLPIASPGTPALRLLLKYVKLLHDWKYSFKRSEFVGFYLYLCHIIQMFIIVLKLLYCEIYKDKTNETI